MVYEFLDLKLLQVLEEDPPQSQNVFVLQLGTVQVKQMQL